MEVRVVKVIVVVQETQVGVMSAIIIVRVWWCRWYAAGIAVPLNVRLGLAMFPVLAPAAWLSPRPPHTRGVGTAGTEHAIRPMAKIARTAIRTARAGAYRRGEFLTNRPGVPQAAAL